jgi:hypothetical protein
MTSRSLPVAVDEAISRLEQLLQSARGEPWAEANNLSSLAVQYGYAGRFDDARRAATRSEQMLTEIGAKFQKALCDAFTAGQIELIAAELAAAEHQIRDGYQTLRDMGERGYRSTIRCMLAEALYAQGRLGEAERLTAEAQAIGSPDNIDVQARWRAISAKLRAKLVRPTDEAARTACLITVAFGCDTPHSERRTANSARTRRTADAE